MTGKTLPMDPRQINSPQSFGEFLQEQNAMGQFTTVVVDPRNIFFDSFPDQETAEHTPYPFSYSYSIHKYYYKDWDREDIANWYEYIAQGAKYASEFDDSGLIYGRE